MDLPVVQEVADDLDVRRLLAKWDTSSEPSRSKPHSGLNLDYRQEWDERRGMFRDVPLHDWASHGAEMFRYAALVEDQMILDKPRSLLLHAPPLPTDWQAI